MVIDLDSGGATREEPRGRSRRRRIALIGGAVAILAGAAVWIPVQHARSSRAAAPSNPAQVALAVGNSFQVDAEPATRVGSYAFTMVNDGSTAILIEGMGRSGPGLELMRVQPSRAELAPAASIDVILRFHVSDCAAVSTNPWPLPVRIRAAGKVSTQYLTLRAAGPRNQWQHDLSAAVCNPTG
jgi:hypothetical protein